MENVAADILGSVAKDVIGSIAAPIKRQFKYLCCFSTNITNLKQEAAALEDTTRDLQAKVGRATDEARAITHTVETWLTKSKDIKDETDGILHQVPNVESGCLKLRTRFSLSRRAKKTTDRLIELRGQCTFDADAISLPRPPPATEAVPLETTYDFKSRKQIEEDIMTALVGEDACMIGICGMGGLGKTTMAKKIMNRALKEHLFEEVVMAVVSQPPVDKLKIQLEIGGSLGLKLEGETSQCRVQKLHARLSSTKRILLVLDDVWERLVPEDLGIPCNHKGCTILLTSRNRDVLSSMNVQKLFGMEVLSGEDAWFMFRERVGTCVDDIKLNSFAEDVVNECKGLPIALTTVGAALKDKMDECIWKDALRQLRQCDPDIPELIANVYNSLKLSYDVLGLKHKSVFLLCCLYPEDAEIPLERLTYFGMGLRIFEGGIRNVVEARNRMRALTQTLISQSLLLRSKYGNDDYVRMHDVVRDVCIFIAKQEGYIGGNDCTWISSSQTSELPNRLGFPNLRLLFLQHEGSKLDSSLIEGIKNLCVLSIGRLSLTSLPQTTHMKYLNTLVLDSCKGFETLSAIGELVNLEILICRFCHSIEELPEEMKGLIQLKLLDLTGCYNLKRIGRGIISSLVYLEELKMLDSFKKWEAEDREERENAGLRELEALTDLRWLEIEIEDPALASEKIQLSSKMERFYVTFSQSSYPGPEFDSYRSFQKLSLRCEEEGRLGDWIEMRVLRNTECLHLTGNGANKVDLAKIQNIKLLGLDDCETMKKIVTSMDGGATVFSSVEYLNLCNLAELEKLWDGRVSPNSFQNLKELKFSELPARKRLWKTSSLARDCLPQLESLRIWRCQKMEQVFMCNKDEESESQNPHHITIIFPKLKTVYLRELPKLTSFYQGIEGIEFPQLKTLDIKRCGKMNIMVSKGMGSNENNSGGCNNANIHKPQEMSFGCLKELATDWNPFRGHKIHVSIFEGLEKFILREYKGSMSFITSSIAGNLVNLKQLKIFGCDEMVQVIRDDGEENGMNSGQTSLVLFPKMEMLWLYGLSKLVSFCELKCDVVFPSLREVSFIECPNMKNFTLGCVAAPNLKCFTTSLHNNLHLEVPFNSLKELTIQRNVNPLTCSKIDEPLFNGLEQLNIYDYGGAMSLFSFSISGSLVNLTKLRMQWCFEMVKVMEDEEEAVSGSQRTLLFPKLRELVLYDLPKLVSFCEWKSDVELPSLRELRICRCYHMKNFTLGPLATPNLEITRIDDQDFGGKKDLNGVLHQYYFTRLKEEEEVEEMTMASEQHQERIGETEEEQN